MRTKKTMIPLQKIYHMFFFFVLLPIFLFLPAIRCWGKSGIVEAKSVTLHDGLAEIQQIKIECGAITSIEHADAGEYTYPDGHQYQLPTRTTVKISLHPVKGSNINVELWLPDADKWNGRFLALGNGGAAGHINSLGLAGTTAQGFATATTDMGTAPEASSGNGNPEVWKDFGFRATHLMTVVAKQIAMAYYGKAPQYSYFSGGSTGGQQALQEAQRYPEDYDGIVANVPAHCRTPLHAYFLWNYQILQKCPFTDTQQANIIAAGNEYMASREVPATAGKVVTDPRCTAKDIAAVIALAMKKDATLTQAHAEAMRKLFDGPRHAITSERIFDGIPIGSDFTSAAGNLYLFNWVFGPHKNLSEIDFGKDFDAYTAALAPYLNAENSNLTPFFDRGGKLLMVSGSADAVVPYHATLDYYEQVIEHFGSLDTVKSFYRYFIVPGGNHGLASPAISGIPNLLDVVIRWREKNAAPGVLWCRQLVDGHPGSTFPLYPYPSKTAWDDQTKGYKPVDGPRGGVDRVSERFRPHAAE